MTKMRSLLPLFAMLLLSACASQVERDASEAFDRTLDQAVADSEAAATPPPEVSADMLPPLTLGSSKPPAEERFDISVSNVPARDFFLGLVAGTPHNMVVHPEVGGAISLQLKGVTVAEALETVRDVYGYEFSRAGAGYRVLPAELQSRIFQVNYLNISRSGSSSTRVSSGQISDSVDSDGESNSESISGSQIQTNTASDFWGELRLALEAIVGKADGRRVVVNPQSGVVVVRAMPVELREVALFLNTTETVMARQVILEAKILEVTLNDGFQSGINWAALATHDNNYVGIAGQTGGGTSTTTGISEISGQTGNLDPSNLSQISGNLSSAFGGVFSLALQSNRFTSFIELLKTQGDVRVLSSPRVSTVNNQKAVIKVGSDEFFVTDIDTTTTSGTATTDSLDVELTPFFSGIALDVTPQIGGDGYVILHIHPSVSEVVDQTKIITAGNTTQTLPLAFSSVRETDSVVRAQSGQIVVLGGLMQDRVADQNASTPGLSDIPLVGELFKHRRKANSRSELVILLRPVVVDDNQVWNDDIRAVRGRMPRYRDDQENQR